MAPRDQQVVIEARVTALAEEEDSPRFADIRMGEERREMACVARCCRPSAVARQ